MKLLSLPRETARKRSKPICPPPETSYSFLIVATHFFCGGTPREKEKLFLSLICSSKREKDNHKKSRAAPWRYTDTNTHRVLPPRWYKKCTKNNIQLILHRGFFLLFSRVSISCARVCVRGSYSFFSCTTFVLSLPFLMSYLCRKYWNSLPLPGGPLELLSPLLFLLLLLLYPLPPPRSPSPPLG